MGESENFPRAEQNLLDYLFVLARWRRFITASTLAVTIAAVATSLVLPETWTAQTKLLPPEEEGGARMGLSLFMGNAVPTGLRNLVGGATPSERLITLLESNRVAGGVVDEFELVSKYEVGHRERAIEILREQIEYELEDDGSLTIRVTADDPQIASDLTNGVARQLDMVNRQYKRQQARDLREFLEKRIELTEEELKLSARSLQSFQEKHGLVDLEAQTSAAVDVMKGIVSEQAELEVELSLLERQLVPQHEDRKLLELKVNALREQVEKLQGDLAIAGGHPGQRQNTEPLESLAPPFRKLPKLMLEYSELTLGVELGAEIIRFLGTKFEEAKYREALNTPTLQILDQATPPRTRSGPRRTLIVIGAFAVSALLSMVLAFLFEACNRLDRENQQKLASIRRELKG